MLIHALFDVKSPFLCALICFPYKALCITLCMYYYIMLITHFTSYSESVSKYTHVIGAIDYPIHDNELTLYVQLLTKNVRNMTNAEINVT